MVGKETQSLRHQSHNDTWDKLRRFVEGGLFPLILFLYPLRHIRVGVEWWDTGYNYGNFLYMDRMDPMWVFSTYLGNALGNLFTRLPFGNTMMGLNFYTGLLVSLLALSGYFFFTRKIKIPSWIAFAGELLAVSLCWCPTALLYNYLTYVLFGAGTVLLYYALTEEKTRYFILAGACLGVNVFVRFPNLAEMALILAVWAYSVVCRDKFRGKKGRLFLHVTKEAALRTLYCVIGYAAGILLCLGYLAARYGLDAYVSAITRLLSMPSEASDYTIFSMVIYQLRNYLQNLLWLKDLALFSLLGIAGFAVLPGRLVRLKKAGYIVCVFGGFYYLMQRNMFNLKYSTKLSVFQWAVFLLTAAILTGAALIFSKKTDSREKLLAGLGILVILVTPLGSNNHLYSSINNLFFVAPFTLWVLLRLLKRLPEELSLERLRERAGKMLPRTLPLFPVKAMVICMLLMLGIQSLGFGFGYVFSESDGGENLHTKIENNGILKGMYTSPDRAEALGTLSRYVEEAGLQGQEIILYGQIPALSYYLQMPFAITSWPDLRSYNYGVMEEDLEVLGAQMEAGTRRPPVLLLEKKYGVFLTRGEPGLRLLGVPEREREAIMSDPKFGLIREWAERFGYHNVFENDKFVLLTV